MDEDLPKVCAQDYFNYCKDKFGPDTSEISHADTCGAAGVPLSQHVLRLPHTWS